jgi:hypothetical protein
MSILHLFYKNSLNKVFKINKYSVNMMLIKQEILAMNIISSFFGLQTTSQVDNTSGLMPLAAGIHDICKEQDYYGFGDINSDLITRAEKAIVDHVKSNNFQVSTLSAVERDIRQKAEKEHSLNHNDTAKKLFEEADFFKSLQDFLTKKRGFLVEAKKLRQENPEKYLAILESRIDSKIALFIDTLLGLKYEVNPDAPGIVLPFISGSRCFPDLINQWRSKTEGEVKKGESNLCNLTSPVVRLAAKVRQLNLNVISIPELIQCDNINDYDQEYSFIETISDYFNEKSEDYLKKANAVVTNAINNWAVKNAAVKNHEEFIIFLARGKWREITIEYSCRQTSLEERNLQRNKKEIDVDSFLRSNGLLACSPKYKIVNDKASLFDEYKSISDNARLCEDISVFINENSNDLKSVLTMLNANPIQYMQCFDSLIPNQKNAFFLDAAINWAMTSKEKTPDELAQWHEKMSKNNKIAEKLLLKANKEMSFVEKINASAVNFVTDEEFDFLMSISKKAAATHTDSLSTIIKAYKGRHQLLCINLCDFLKKYDNIVFLGQLRDLAKYDSKEYLRILNVIDNRRARLIDQLVMAGFPDSATAIINKPEFLQWREQKAMRGRRAMQVSPKVEQVVT